MHSRFQTEAEFQAYRRGSEDALRFNANPDGILSTLFKAETAEHKFHIGFDDVEFGVYIEVTFKHRYDSEHNFRKVMVGRGRFPSAMARVLDFLSRHPHHEPYCSVDY